MTVQISGRKKGILKVKLLFFIFNKQFLTIQSVEQGINRTCICKKMYCPPTDHQRYCIPCKMWYHAECLELCEEEGQIGPEIIHYWVNKCPLMRGWDGGEGRSWETVGNCRKVLTVRFWYVKRMLPKDWKEKLGAPFVDEMTKKKWARYKCPTCEKHI
jgi:hypothetical protein